MRNYHCAEFIVFLVEPLVFFLQPFYLLAKPLSVVQGKDDGFLIVGDSFL